MSIISFGPNQQLTAQQRAAYETSQQAKSFVWDTIHRLAALNDVPGVDEPDNGDDVDVRTPTPLPPAHPQSTSNFEANATGRVERADDGQLVGGEVHAQLSDGRQWVIYFRQMGSDLLYSAPSSVGQGQVHVVENTSNGLIEMFESDRFHPQFAEEIQRSAAPEPPPPLPPPPPPGFKEEGGARPHREPQPVTPTENSYEQFGNKLTDLARQGKEKASSAMGSNDGRKWAKILFGNLGMEILDKAMGKKTEQEPN